MGGEGGADFDFRPGLINLLNQAMTEGRDQDQDSPATRQDLDGWCETEELTQKAKAIREAAAYINRVGRILGSHEYRHKMTGVPEFLGQLADAVEAGVVTL